MNDLLQVIRALSLSDTKSLTATTLKTAEELGELAKVVLPYENNFATTHRFVTSNKILEEAVDVLLCAISVAYKINASDEDIRDMIIAKCNKWDMMQHQSNQGTFPVPFEMHITVKCTPDKIQHFKYVCEALKVKSIVLDLTDTIQDVMTSSVIVSDNNGAYNEMKRISSGLIDAGFQVIREKIETVPWHPGAPNHIDLCSNKQYFECHLNILVNAEELAALKQFNIDASLQLHFSKNVNKIINEHDFLQMATFRARDGNFTNTMFEEHIAAIRKCIEESGILREGAIQKQILEFAIYDTNISHDLQWLNGG